MVSLFFFNKALIITGAVLMVVNIVRYWGFMDASRGLLDGDRRLIRWRQAGILLLSFFLAGYIIAAFLNVNIILSFILFFGSIYVYVVLNQMMDLVYKQHHVMSEAVDDAADTETKTGMYNLNGFSRHVENIIRHDSGKKYIVVQWDIEEFKLFNDIHGYSAGDELLRKIGHSSPEMIRDGLVFGHLVSDHFVILAENKENSAEEIYRSITKMLSAIHEGDRIDIHMGICAVEDPEESVASLCDHALIALRTVKDRYQDRYAWYEPGMRDMIIEERKLVAEMNSALETGQFRVWYQPQVNYKTGKVTGAEALVRWIHPERGIIPPGQFIPLFEKNGFITQLDRYIWEQVCIFQRDLLDKGLKTLPISVNISRHDIFNCDLPSHFEGLMQKYKLDPSLLNLEITETVYMTSPEILNGLVKTLQNTGFLVEMDDFGSGYSSLNTLKDMEVNTIKLDMKFLQYSENSDRSGRIISAVIRMADWLDVDTIAEGVETKEQADFLKSIGCDNMQGYYFFKPMPEAEYRRIIETPDLAEMSVPMSRKHIDGSLDFMDSAAQNTLMFNSFTGMAMIADYHNGILEVLRVNDRMFALLRDAGENRNLFQCNILERFAPDQQELLRDAIDQAIYTQNEAECVVCVENIGEEGNTIWMNLRMRMISSRGQSTVLYFSVLDITDHWKKEELEKQLETMFKNVPAGVVTFEIKSDASLSLQYVSEHVFNIFRLDPAQCRVDEELLTSDFGITEDMIEEVMHDKDGDIHYFEKIAKRASDGTNFWLQIQMVMREEEGQKIVYSVFNDVTEHYDSEAQQYAILQAIPGGFIRYSCDEAEEVAYVSDGLLELLGYTREEFKEIYDDRFSPMVYEEDRERVLQEINDQIGSNGSSDMCKYRIRTRDGQLRWVYDTAYVTTDSDGRRWFNVVILDLNMQTDNDKWIS